MQTRANYRHSVGALAAGLCLVSLAGVAVARDACRDWGIVATADVAVSDGSDFKVRTVFQGLATAAFDQIADETTTVAVDGGYSWLQRGDQAQQGTDFHKLFALGHQFHAFLFHFDELVRDVRVAEVEIDGKPRPSRVGDYPYGGQVHQIVGHNRHRPHGLRFDFPERESIWVTFDDWRTLQDRDVPYRMTIDDGERNFDYRYTGIELSAGSASWYHRQVPVPALDAVQVHRLHRAMLAAHCDGNADAMAELSAPSVLSVNRGEISETTASDMAKRFSGLFERLDYQLYADTRLPQIEIAANGDLGWAAVQVKTTGEVRKTQQRFHDQWAWVMLARKIDGVWKHAGNASNRKPQASRARSE